MAWVRCRGGSRFNPIVLWDSGQSAQYAPFWTNGSPDWSANNGLYDGYQTSTKNYTLDKSYNGKTLHIEYTASRTNLVGGSYGRTTIKVGTVSLDIVGTSDGTFTADIPITSSSTLLSLVHEFNGESGLYRIYGISFAYIDIR